MKKGQRALKTLMPPELLDLAKERRLGYGDALKMYDMVLEGAQQRLIDGDIDVPIHSSLAHRVNYTEENRESRFRQYLEIMAIRADLDKAMLPYHKPKLQATQLSGDEDAPLRTLVQVEVVGDIDADEYDDEYDDVSGS